MTEAAIYKCSLDKKTKRVFYVINGIVRHRPVSWIKKKCKVKTKWAPFWNEVDSLWTIDLNNNKAAKGLGAFAAGVAAGVFVKPKSYSIEGFTDLSLSEEKESKPLNVKEYIKNLNKRVIKITPDES